MRFKFPLLVFCLAAFLASAAYAQNNNTTQESAEKEYHAKQQLMREEEKNKTIHIGDYDITRANRESITATLSQLLWVGHDDLKKAPEKAGARQRQYEKDDINARKKYFSEAAWQQYEGYISEQRTLLKRFGGNHMATANWGSGFNTMQYKPASQGMITLSADGSMYYDSQDNWCATGVPTRPFNLDVTFLPVKAGTPDNFVIDKWEVQFCGVTELSCLYKNAIPYRRLEFAASSSPIQVEGQKIALEKNASDALSSTLRRMLELPKTASLLPTKGGALVHREWHKRKSYFSEAAWKQYLSFAYNFTLNTFCGYSRVGTQSFDLKKIDDSHFQLVAKADYSDGDMRSTCGRGIIKIQSTFEKRSPANYDFIFTSWNASICNEEGDSCEDYVKIPAQGSEQLVDRSTQYFLFKSLLEWGKRAPLGRPTDGNGAMNLLTDRMGYFSDEAWEEYRKYIEQINSKISGRSRFFKFSPKAESFKVVNTNEILFSTKGTYTDVGPTIDRLNRSGSFETAISFKKTGENADDIEITNWSVTMPDDSRESE